MYMKERFTSKKLERLCDETVKTSDLRFRNHGFDTRSRHYQAVTTWIVDCLRTNIDRLGI